MKTIKPIFVEVLAVRGGNGKTTASRRIGNHFYAMGRPVDMVRVESKQSLWTPSSHEIFIKSEDLAESNNLVGGSAAVLAPMKNAIDQSIDINGVVIADYGAGLTDARLDLLVSTRFDERLMDAGIVGYSCIVTHRGIDSMRQAADSLKQTRESAPGMHRILILNEVVGDFDFAAGTEAARIYGDLLAEAETAKLVTLPAIRGKAMEPFEAIGLTALDVLHRDPEWLAQKIGLDSFITTACISNVAAWWRLTEAQLSKVFPAPAND